MYCVIQEREIQKANKYGKSKELIIDTTTCTFQGKTSTSYNYHKGDKKFIRSIKKTYKISIHESYRDHGVVKKKQWVVCTMNYYDIAEGNIWIQDFMRLSRWDKLLKDINISEDELGDMVYKKLDLLRESIQKEFEQTEEYKAIQDQDKITTLYYASKITFEEKYGKDTYNYCYDVFGVLRNEKYLDKIKLDYETQSSYQENKQDNYKYNWNDFNNAFGGVKQITHSEGDKENLKKFYKTLAMKFHPDHCNDDGEAMKLLNSLKKEWGI